MGLYILLTVRDSPEAGAPASCVALLGWLWARGALLPARGSPEAGVRPRARRRPTLGSRARRAESCLGGQRVVAGGPLLRASPRLHLLPRSHPASRSQWATCRWSARMAAPRLPPTARQRRPRRASSRCWSTTASSEGLRPSLGAPRSAWPGACVAGGWCRAASRHVPWLRCPLAPLVHRSGGLVVGLALPYSSTHLLLHPPTHPPTVHSTLVPPPPYCPCTAGTGSWWAWPSPTSSSTLCARASPPGSSSTCWGERSGSAVCACFALERLRFCPEAAGPRAG